VGGTGSIERLDKLFPLSYDNCLAIGSPPGYPSFLIDFAV